MTPSRLAMLLSLPSPAKIFTSGAAGLWLYPRDLSLTFQDSGATTNGAIDSPAGKMLDRSGRGNHLSQATDGLRPTLKMAGGVYSYLFDGSDDDCGTTFSAGTLTASMDAFFVLRRNSLGNSMFAQQEALGPSYFGVMDANASDPHAGVGTAVTYYLNGAPAGATRTALNTAVPVGTWVVFEARDLDLSSWTGFRMGDYGSGYLLRADIAGLVLCPSQTDAVRRNIRRWCAKEAGVSL